MYTFDLMRAELLIQLANSAANVRKETGSGVLQNRLNDVSGAALEDAKKLIMAAKPDTKLD